MSTPVCFTERIEQFLHNVQKAYEESYCCVTCTSGIGKEVIRGRARCVAGRVEDLFAETLYDVLKDRITGLLIFVDLPLSYEYDDNGKKTKAICYPDVVVAQMKEGRINVLYLVELKINLGWERHKLAGERMVKNDKTGNKEVERVTPIEDEIVHELKELIGAKVWSKVPLGMESRQALQDVMNSGELQFVVSQDVRYDLIVCSSKNVPEPALQKARERIKDDLNAVCQMYVLSKEELSLKYARNKHDTNALLRSNDVDKWKKRIDALVEGVKQG